MEIPPEDLMPSGKKKPSERAKGRKITLKMVREAVKLTMDGKRRLDLSNMGITTFPKCLLKFCSVEELDLSRNMLKKIPESIDAFVNLRCLDLHSNHLEKLPEAIGRLPNLLELNLCNNLLTTEGLPHSLSHLKSLRNLNLGMNRLETAPSFVSSLRELRVLGLFDNLLTSNPQWLRNLPNLEKLNTKGNPVPPNTPLDPIRRVEELYLVRECCLCGDCAHRHIAERERMDFLINLPPVRRRPHFARFAPPNSATEDPAVRR
ncbi:leucine-rich repeat-containing protein 18 [Hoplias malabaricus]|uniref:leucine-rich repeat-containing protein 18 n=1 Tax=Hoplias malabaricus TaxID=27720 RepID=UPI00346231B8